MNKLRVLLASRDNGSQPAQARKNTRLRCDDLCPSTQTVLILLDPLKYEHAKFVAHSVLGYLGMHSSYAHSLCMALVNQKHACN
jgi:hypothetical protein